MPTYTFLHNDITHTVVLKSQPDGSTRAEIDGRVYVFRAAIDLDGATRITFASGERITAYASAQGNTRYVQINGAVITLNVPDTDPSREARTGRRGSAGAGGDLTASMPGQVRDVLVSEGETVKRGQALVVLEAMKMEIRVTATVDGVVKRVLVSKGDVVDRGQVLVEVESEK